MRWYKNFFQFCALIESYVLILFMRKYIPLLLVLFFVQNLFGQKFLPDTLRTCTTDSILIQRINSDIDIYKWSDGDTLNVIALDTSQVWVKHEGWFYAYGEGSIMLPKWDSVLVMMLDVSIETNDTSIICGDTINLKGTSDQYSYLWTPGDLLGQEVEVFPRDTTTYFAKINDLTMLERYCVDSVVVTVEPVIVVDTIIQLLKACPDVKEAAMEVELSGGFFPYHYEWSEGYPYISDSSQVLGLSDGNYQLSVTDSLGCKLNYSFEVEAYELPQLEIETTPGDTIYFTKPFIDIAYFNQSADSVDDNQYRINTFLWKLGDGETRTEESFSYEYKVEDPLAEDPQTFNLSFNYTTYYGCPGVDSTVIVLKPVKMLVTPVLTPNGDDFNQFFKLQLEGAGENEMDMFVNDFYISSELYVINRWGVQVYEDKDYKNDWDGSNLPDGAYYYVLKCKGKNLEDDKPHLYKGILHVIR